MTLSHVLLYSLTIGAMIGILIAYRDMMRLDEIEKKRRFEQDREIRADRTRELCDRMKADLWKS